MKAEIISIGTELLLGQTINTNACFLADEFQSLGIDSYFQTTVGDNAERIHEVLKLALQRADIIITTGGLGPTPDDLTHEAIYSFFKVKPQLDKKNLQQIKNKFYLRGYKKMPEMNIKQAYKSKNAKWIPNKLGTANGIIWKISASGRFSAKGGPAYGGETRPSELPIPHHVLILTFPGVPSEMKQMWTDAAVPYLKKLSKGNILYSKTLKYTGIGESALAEKIKKYFNQKNPTVAPYASLGEVKIRVTAKSKSMKIAKSLVLKTVKNILKKTKSYFYGFDDETLESLLANKLKEKKKTIALAESCTGGFLSKRLTDIPGSSDYIKLNLVTYSNEAKNKLLNIPNETLKKYGAVSSQVAALMAKEIKKLSGCAIGFSITGIAGPGGGSPPKAGPPVVEKEKPIGLVYFGLIKGNKVKTQKVLFGTNSTRDEIRFLATQFALNWLRKELS